MRRNNNAIAYPRRVWTGNVAPLVVAAREGASQATASARRELARARRPRRWWQSRWLVLTATGVVAIGVASGVVAAVVRTRTAEQTPDGGELEQPGGSLRSTMEASRARITDLTRHMVHRVRRDREPEGNHAHATASIT